MLLQQCAACFERLLWVWLNACWDSVDQLKMWCSNLGTGQTAALCFSHCSFSSGLGSVSPCPRKKCNALRQVLWLDMVPAQLWLTRKGSGCHWWQALVLDRRAHTIPGVLRSILMMSPCLHVQRPIATEWNATRGPCWVQCTAPFQRTFWDGLRPTSPLWRSSRHQPLQTGEWHLAHEYLHLWALGELRSGALSDPSMTGGISHRRSRKRSYQFLLATVWTKYHWSLDPNLRSGPCPLSCVLA